MANPSLQTLEQEELDASMMLLGPILVLSLEPILYPELVNRLRNRMLERLRELPTPALALSFVRVTSVDARTIVALRRLLSSAKLLGATVYIVKLRPAIAATIVNLDECLPGAVEVQNLQEAMIAQQAGRAQ